MDETLMISHLINIIPKDKWYNIRKIILKIHLKRSYLDQDLFEIKKKNSLS